VFAVKYDANGLWIENSWGTSWGLNGYGELSWSFVNRYVSEAVSIDALLPGDTVPNVVGQLARTAGSRVRAAGFGVAITSAIDRTCNNAGLVMLQAPRGGTWAFLGTTVTLTMGQRPRTPCP
jgi:hypothetical protein